MKDMRAPHAPLEKIMAEGLDFAATYQVSMVDLYAHTVLRAYALGYAGRARRAERMRVDRVLKVPRGGLVG